MAEGSGVSRVQLTTFASKADGAAQAMQGAVTTLEGDLSILEAASKGAFASRFAQVKMQIQDELNTMNRALSATAADSNTAAQKFTSGDEEQEQQVRTAGDQAVGLTSGLPV